jgi:hypothetical protein
VMLTCSHGSVVFGVSAITTGGFTSTASWWGSGATSSYTMTWRASGYTTGNTI